MIPESYLSLWSYSDLMILALTKLYVFKVLSKMLGDIKIHEAAYNILCGLFLVISITIKMVEMSIPVSFAIGICTVWVLLSASYEASLVQRWIVVISWLSAIIISEALTDSIIYGVYNMGTLRTFIYVRTLYSVGMLFKCILLIAQLKIYRRLEVCITNDKWAGAGILIPLVINSTIVVFIFYYFSINNIRVGMFAGLLIYLVIALMLVNIAIVFSAGRLAKFYEMEMERREAKERSEAEYEYYSHLEEEQERIRLLYHDINNHIACIKEVAREQTEVVKYIDALEKDMQGTKKTYKTGCSVVDAILRQKSMRCEKGNIDLSVNLNLSICDFMESQDLCSIFANALDNAIEACEKITSSYAERYIYMESQTRQGFLVIKIKNSKEHMNRWINKVLVTQKKDKQLHGLGLKNIKRALEKYEGEYVIKEENYEFYLKLVIPIKSSSCS